MDSMPAGEVIYLHKVRPERFNEFGAVDKDFAADMQALAEAASRPWPEQPWEEELVVPEEPPEEVASPSPPTPVAFSGPITPIARPQTPRDLSNEISSLPPVDGVEAVMALLVPDECRFSYFLDDWSVLKGRMSIHLENPITEATEEAKAKCLNDVKTLSATALRKRYPKEANSHKNRKSEAEKNGWPWHPDFEKFDSFLRIMGPMPSYDVKFTLDCINPHKHEYAPGKCRWLDPKGQVQNRRNTIKLTYNGTTAPMSAWAEVTCQPYDRLHARHKNGWSDQEVIFGKGGRMYALDQKPWNHHADESQRKKAEDYFRRNAGLVEAPIAFCLRIFRYGTRPWEEFLQDNLDPKDVYADIAPQCVPQLKAARQMLFRLEPVGRWLERNLPKESVQQNKAVPTLRGTRRPYKGPNLNEEVHAEHYAERAYDGAYDDDEV